MTMSSDSRTMDADRSHADTEFGRATIIEFNPVEVYVVEMDSRVSMPLRLAHNQVAGLHIEFGPYDLGHAEIAALRRAIAIYDESIHGAKAMRGIDHGDNVIRFPGRRDTP
jgi:hypothetical protein